MSKIKQKIHTLASLKEKCLLWKKEGSTIVFTNGCFDLIHPGHVLYLETAREKGDRLIVALNSDASVSRLKGPERPVQNELARMLVISALESVDAVVLFEEDTPISTIEAVAPDVLVKGGDWAVENIVGADLVIKSGGQVLSLPFEGGYSTTSIVDKIRRHEGE